MQELPNPCIRLPIGLIQITNNMRKVLVIIPCLNLWDRYTIHCMESIYASKGDTPFDILIVDNASIDSTEEKARDFGNRKMPERVIVIRNEENKGCGGGWNQGVAYGMENGYSHFLILNNDILMGPNTIQNLTDWIDESKALLVSAVDVSGELMVPEHLLNQDNPINHKDRSSAPHPNFSCFMITRETVERVGYFDSITFYPAYFEDNSYHYRIKLLAGEQSAVATTVGVFYHYGSRTQNEAVGAPVVPSAKFEENRRKYIELWGSEPTKETYTSPWNDATLTCKVDKDGNYIKQS